MDLGELEERTNEEYEPVIGMIFVNVLPIHGQSITKVMPEMISVEHLRQDTERTDRHVLQLLLNAGHGELNHNVFTMKC
jgi:hypothetical protein